MKMEPASTSSSPASIRRAVVLPDPEGPTSTTNSPSPISRSSASTAGLSVPGYTRVACSYRTSAIAPSDHHGFALELLTHPRLRLAVDSQLVEDEQRRPDDRRSGRRPHDRTRCGQMDALR